LHKALRVKTQQGTEPAAADDVWQLNLADTAVGDAGLKELAGLRNLGALDLSGTGITPGSLAALERLPRLQRLNLADTAIADRDASALGRCRGLQSLDLFATAVTDAGLRHLKSLRQLQFLVLAQPTVVVRSVAPPSDPKERRSWILRYGLTRGDLERYRTLAGVSDVVPLRFIPTELRYQQKAYEARVVATTENYAKVHRCALAAGRFLKDAEDQPPTDDSRAVIVLGARVAEALFPVEEAVGKSVVLGGQFFRVVGVLKDRRPQEIGGEGPDCNKDAYIPLAAGQQRFGQRVFLRKGGTRTAEHVELDRILVTVADPQQAPSCADTVRQALKETHERKDWEVTEVYRFRCPVSDAAVAELQQALPRCRILK
jgi:hypothetical protein